MPASISCNRYVFAIALMRFHPVEQRQFILGKLRQDFRNLVSVAQLFSHICSNFINSLIAGMLIKGFKQVEFGISSISTPRL